MERIKRNERLGVMLSTLSQTPNQIHTLGEFCEKLDAAKSTISEDIDILRKALDKHGLGELSTIAGAAGGVRYRATVGREQARAFWRSWPTASATRGGCCPADFCTPPT